MTNASGERFGVTPQDVIAHARSVDDIAAQVDLGRSAAAHVRLGRDAYGQLCQLIPSLLDPIQSAGVDALAEAVDALQDMADALRATATGYQGVDGTAERRFEGLYRS